MNNDLSYSQWIEKNHSTLKAFGSKQLVLSFSGGKDSSVLLHFFSLAQQDYDFDLHVHGVAVPSHVFNTRERDRLTRYWKKRSIEIVWHESDPEQEALMDEMVATGKTPCLLCSRIKKKRLLSYFNTGQFPHQNLVVVIGYTLWDLASATIEHTLRTGFGGGGTGNFQGTLPEDRFLEISQRFFPLLELKNGITVFKPLIQYNDPQIQAATKKYDIPTTREPCRFKTLRPKRLLANYYSLFGLNFNYDDVHSFAGNAFNLPEIDFFQSLDIKTYIYKMI